MDADIRPIRKLKWAQLRLLALYYWFKREQRPIRIIILKARKEGLSTLTQALMLIEALERGINAVVIARENLTAQDIFEIGERFYTKYDLKKPDLPHLWFLLKVCECWTVRFVLALPDSPILITLLSTG